MDEATQPIATYRVQFNADFRFEDARELASYLSRLGITHVYSSPILRARQNSVHGYDVVDPVTLNPSIGDELEFQGFVSALQAHGMGLILDIVPNHMAASPENPYWREVLTYGASSSYARWFDINWRMPEPRSWGRVLVPILGRPLPQLLANNEIRVDWSEGRFIVRYADHKYPLDPTTIPMVCRFGLEDLAEMLPAEHPTYSEVRTLLSELSRLPRRATRLRRQVEFPIDAVEQRLGQLAQRIEASPQTHDWAVATAARFSEGEAGQARVRKLLDAQPYRLVYWREAARAINYRRFFDINDLISIRQEDPEVFSETHALIARWITEGMIDGVRIDHLDGLRDPLGYLERLMELIEDAGRHAVCRSLWMPEAAGRGVSALHTRARGGRGENVASAPQSTLTMSLSRPFHVFVEKILAHDQQLPDEWPISGTTGYEFLNQVESLFIHPEGWEEVEDNYLGMIGRPLRFKNIAAWGKRRVLRQDLSAFVGRLADVLGRLARDSGRYPDLTQSQLVAAIREVVVALRVYRTYIQANAKISGPDRDRLRRALARARRSHRADSTALEFLGEVLLLEGFEELPANEQQARISFIERFQQLTGPTTAKGIEDTALYAYTPLASRNEVGGDPDAPIGEAVSALHRNNRHRQATFPYSMLCATTHDTKRSADIRSRIDVLSEIPKLWSAFVKRWQRLNSVHCRRVGGKTAPDANSEYLFYQSLVGIWPAPDPQCLEDCFPNAAALNQLRERLEEYMLKAVREAKTRTNWVHGNAAYEDAIVAFIRSVLLPAEASQSAFLADVHQVVGRIARAGFWNALSRTLIQCTAPGSPDLYQGDELWNFVLVDPDNRRPIDHAIRRRLLDELITEFDSLDASDAAGFVKRLVADPEDGRIKMHMVRCALHARREHPELFTDGEYVPLEVSGPAREHVFAFARAAGDTAAVVIAPRLTASLVEEPTAAPAGREVWRDTAIVLPGPLEGRTWSPLLTREPIFSANRTLPVGQALSIFPVALLLSSAAR